MAIHHYHYRRLNIIIVSQPNKCRFANKCPDCTLVHVLPEHLQRIIGGRDSPAFAKVFGEPPRINLLMENRLNYAITNTGLNLFHKYMTGLMGDGALEWVKNAVEVSFECLLADDVASDTHICCQHAI